MTNLTNSSNLISKIESLSPIEYNAGKGISIGDISNGRRGPSPEGFHVPSVDEWQGLKAIMDGLSLTTGDDWNIYLHMPFTGYRHFSNASLNSQGGRGVYWSSSPISAGSDGARLLFLTSSDVNASEYGYRASGRPVRCFKDSYATPDSTWTIEQGTLGSAGIFRNESLGLISITDGSTGYTIMDKNLGATEIYYNGDALMQEKLGNMYQRGNNYGFPSVGTISNTSSEQVDASAYGPGNYYSSDTFITGNNDRSSVHNDDLWGDTTGVVGQENVISNIGVTSVNGQTGDVTIDSFSPAGGDGTEGQVLTKTSNGYSWQDAGTGGIANDTDGTDNTITKEWVGTKEEYEELSSYGDTIYNIIE